MKRKKKMKAIAVLSVVIVMVAVAVMLAFKYKDRLFPAETTTVPVHTQSETETTAETVTVSEEKTTENEDGKNGKDKEAKTILNYSGKADDYTPTAFEAKLFNAINEKRTEKELPALNWNNCLYEKAKIRSDETLSAFSHRRPDGRKPSTVLSDEKIEFSLFGECLAKGTRENDEGVRLLLDGLLMDEKQNDAIFSKDYQYSAISVSLDEDGNVYAAILLCNP